VSSLVLDLATALRERVAPRLGAMAGRAHERAGAGGDVTFAIDEEAEAFLAEWVATYAPGVAFYSEDRGLVTPPGVEAPEQVLVVDPIDGTRPALAGFEAACTSVAVAPARGAGGGPPTMGDVTAGAVVEIKSGDWFLAERGRGCRSSVPIAPSPAADPARMFWTFGFRGRPARLLMEVLGDLVDASSVGGGVFDLGSACFDLTRVLTGQLDAYIEPGPRIVAEVPGARADYERVGGGAVLNNSPYDLAAAVLCAAEGGVVVTDAAGRALDDRPLLGSGAEHQMSVLAAGSPALHARLLEEVHRGLARASEWANLRRPATAVSDSTR
jgi:myo-inositol-1(or 4)-monophosphatase